MDRPEPMTTPRDRIAVWLPLIRPFTLTAAAVPVLLGSALARWDGAFAASSFVALLLAAMLIQAATNMLNEYFDYQRGVDTRDSVGIAGSIVRGDLAARAVLRGALVALSLALLCGLYLVVVVSPWLLLVGALSVLGAWAYSGGPRAVSSTPFGEAQVFVLMGLLLVGLGYYVHAGTVTGGVLVASLPVSCLVAAILLGNNIRDMDGDEARGRRTLPIVVGRWGGVMTLIALVCGAYLLLLLAVLAGAAPWLALLAFASLPLAPAVIRLFRSTTVPLALHPAVKGIARLHLVQGSLYAAGVTLASLL
ncbi:MAG TPA: 1,4-dihydroxy-2-naphthoate polyprenyltransferase [Thermomicrobiales bacterium]|nr:1,4-dihydroxy-2-naphthoate polyprenyltransferase [Thermomicrobiales bacterium]